MKRLLLVGGLLILALSGCTDRKAEHDLLVLKILGEQRSEARQARIDRDARVANDERERRAEERQWREQRAAQCRADAAAEESAAEVAVAQAERAEYARRFAPEGTLYLLRTVNVPIKGGLSSLLPGTEVTLVHENPNGTLHVKQADGTLQTDIQTAWATDDRDLAAGAQCADAATQAVASYAADRMQAQAAWQERRQRVRNGLAMDAAGGQFQRPQVQFGTNPLDGGSY